MFICISCDNGFQFNRIISDREDDSESVGSGNLLSDVSVNSHEEFVVFERVDEYE